MRVVTVPISVYSMSLVHDTNELLTDIEHCDGVLCFIGTRIHSLASHSGRVGAMAWHNNSQEPTYHRTPRATPHSTRSRNSSHTPQSSQSLYPPSGPYSEGRRQGSGGSSSSRQFSYQSHIQNAEEYQFHDKDEGCGGNPNLICTGSDSDVNYCRIYGVCLCM